MAGYLEYKPPADDNPTVLELSKIEDLSIEPVMTLDDLNVSHVRHTLRVRCLFTAIDAATFYSDLRNITKALTTPRGRLIIATDSTKTTILHDINANADSGTGLRPDIEGGPKPRRLDVQEFITGIAAHIIWTVEYNIIPCDTAANDLPNVLSRHHSVNFAYSDQGRLTRTIDGELRIPDRIKSDVYDKNVQNAQGAAYFHVPKGWRRLSASMGISPNGLVLQFQYVDEELEMGWHDLAQTMDLEWSERSIMAPPSVEFTFSFRIKGRRGIKKRDLINKIVVPMANDLFDKQKAAMLLPGSAEWKEDLLTNEISGSIKLPGSWYDPGAESPGRGRGTARYLLPSSVFGAARKQLKRKNPRQVIINGKATNFDSVLLADDENARKRWETLPLLTRFIIKDVCDRSRIDPSGDYEEEDEDDTVLIELHEEETRPEPEHIAEEEGADKILDILKSEPFQKGNYMVDEEVMQIDIDYHTTVIGNQNIVNINSDGERELTENKSQRLYQDRVPTMVVKVVGRAVRIGEQAAPRPIPIIIEPAADGGKGSVEIALVPKKIKVTTFGPHVAPGGKFASYGVQWSYILTRELGTTFFEIDAETALTKFKMPKRKTRVSKLFTGDTMEKLHWNADDVL